MLIWVVNSRRAVPYAPGPQEQREIAREKRNKMLHDQGLDWMIDD